MPEAEEATIRAVVVYAETRRACLFEVRVPAGSSVRQAVGACGILQAIPELALRELEVGVFGQSCRLDDPVRDGDRIEIYRPLVIDPKQARRQRAALKLKTG